MSFSTWKQNHRAGIGASLDRPRDDRYTLSGGWLETFLLLVILPGGAFAGQLLSGADALAGMFLSLAMSISFAAYLLAGGWRSFLGLAVLIWQGKTLILAIIVKVLIGESSTATLDAPRETALVYLLGSGVIAGAVFFQRFLPIPRTAGIMPKLSPRLFLAMAGFFMVTGIIAPLLVGDRSTNVLVIKGIGGFRDFSIFCAMHWAASKGYRRPFLHPLVFVLLGVCLFLAFTTSSKQALLTPLMTYYLGVLALTGFRFPLIYLPLIPAVLFFQVIAGPVADRMKSQTWGLSLVETATVMIDANFAAIQNPASLKETVASTRVEYERRNDFYYLANLGYIERFALIKTGDKLIYATVLQGTTGWEVILWDLWCLPPRFVAPNKPVQASFNQLARFSGMLADDDFTTSVSFGLFPQLFHAHGYPGVFLLGIAAVTAIFWWFRIFIGDHPHLTFYGLMLIGVIQHTIAEGVLASFLGMYSAPVFILIAMAPAVVLVRFFPGRCSAPRLTGK